MGLEIWMVRHGETAHNADGVFQGQLDSHLNERGRHQARQVGEALKSVAFDALYSSDLRRAADTARAIAGFQDAELVLDRRLRELHYGVLQGVAYANFRQVLAEHGLAEVWGPGLFSETGIAAPGGESQQELRERLREFVEEVIARHEPDERLLVVAHGGTLRTLLTVLLDLPIEARSRFAFANCSVSRVTVENGMGRLDLHNLVHWAIDP